MAIRTLRPKNASRTTAVTRQSSFPPSQLDVRCKPHSHSCGLLNAQKDQVLPPSEVPLTFRRPQSSSLAVASATSCVSVRLSHSPALTGIPLVRSPCIPECSCGRILAQTCPRNICRAVQSVSECLGKGILRNLIQLLPPQYRSGTYRHIYLSDAGLD